MYILSSFRRLILEILDKRNAYIIQQSLDSPDLKLTSKQDNIDIKIEYFKFYEVQEPLEHSTNWLEKVSKYYSHCICRIYIWLVD